MTRFYIITIILLLLQPNAKAQSYFNEDFSNADIIDETTSSWENTFSMFHANPNIDINQNGITDSIEMVKNIEIVADDEDPSNDVLKVTLNRADIDFYTQYKCTNATLNNENTVDSLSQYYDAEFDAYCVGCSESPLGTSNSELKNLMNRNELSTVNNSTLSYSNDRSHWFGFKIKLDNDYQLDTTNNPEIVAQWHIDNQVTANTPPISLNIEKSKWVLKIRPTSDASTWSDHDLGPVTKGEWVEWTFKLKLANTSNRSIVIIMKNDEEVLNLRTKILRSQSPYYFKFGIYKPQWWNCGIYVHSTTDSKVLYFDDVWSNKKSKDPHVSLVAADLDKVLDVSDMTLTVDYYEGYSYKIKFIDTMNNSYVVKTDTNTISMFDYDWLQTRMTYEVYVKVLSHPTQHNYTNNNSYCSTNGLLNHVTEEDNYKILTHSDTKVHAYTIPNATSYKFRIKNVQSGKVRFLTTANPYFDFGNYSWAQPNEEYQILVRMPGHEYMDAYSTSLGVVYTSSDYGQTPAAAARPSQTVEIETLSMYEYALDLKDNQSITTALVTDMSGRQFGINHTEKNIALPRTLNRGVYVISVQTNDGQFISKKIYVEL